MVRDVVSIARYLDGELLQGEVPSTRHVNSVVAIDAFGIPTDRLFTTLVTTDEKPILALVDDPERATLLRDIVLVTSVDTTTAASGALRSADHPRSWGRTHRRNCS